MTEKKGRPLLTDDARAASMLFAVTITRASGLSATALELVIQMESNPAGRNWRRYLKGERTLSAENRDRIGRIAKKNGWLMPLSGAVTPSQTKAYGWIQNGSLEELKARLQAQLAVDKNVILAKSGAVRMLRELLVALELPVSDGLVFINHPSYMDDFEGIDDDGEDVKFTATRSTHMDEFVRSVDDLISKIEAIGTWYPYLVRMESPDD